MCARQVTKQILAVCRGNIFAHPYRVAGSPLHCDGDVVCPRGNKKYSSPALKDTYSHTPFGRAGPPLHCDGDVVCPRGKQTQSCGVWGKSIRTPLSGGQARPYIAVGENVCPQGNKIYSCCALKGIYPRTPVSGRPAPTLRWRHCVHERLFYCGYG